MAHSVETRDSSRRTTHTKARSFTVPSAPHISQNVGTLVVSSAVDWGGGGKDDATGDFVGINVSVAPASSTTTTGALILLGDEAMSLGVTSGSVVGGDSMGDDDANGGSTGCATANDIETGCVIGVVDIGVVSKGVVAAAS
jgi:hypothetical protein